MEFSKKNYLIQKFNNMEFHQVTLENINKYKSKCTKTEFDIILEERLGTFINNDFFGVLNISI